MRDGEEMSRVEVEIVVLKVVLRLELSSTARVQEVCDQFPPQIMYLADNRGTFHTTTSQTEALFRSERNAAQCLSTLLRRTR